MALGWQWPRQATELPVEQARAQARQTAPWQRAAEQSQRPP